MRPRSAHEPGVFDAFVRVLPALTRTVLSLWCLHSKSRILRDKSELEADGAVVCLKNLQVAKEASLPDFACTQATCMLVSGKLQSVLLIQGQDCQQAAPFVFGFCLLLMCSRHRQGYRCMGRTGYNTASRTNGLTWSTFAGSQRWRSSCTHAASRV